MVNKKIIPIILCGGSGSRLWPVSRTSYPKQFLSFISNYQKSLLQRTYSRIEALKNLKAPILICNEDHRFIVAEQMREIGVLPSAILLEPYGKNTAPAITIGALEALKKEDDPILLVLSSDHEIKNNKKFLDTINKGISYAENNKLVTFGVIPDKPSTGYGYIKAEKPFENSQIEGYKIKEFIEKPSSGKAKKFLNDNCFTWNSGIFLFKASEIIKEIEKFNSGLLESCKQALKCSEHDLDFQRLNRSSFSKCMNVSIDIAVMEKTSKGIVLPLDAGWSDIGSWKSVWENSQKDNQLNVKEGRVIIKNTESCYLRSEGRLIVGNGLKDLIVVETADAILVADKNKDQEIKSMVEELKEKNIIESTTHKKVYRPWGFFTSIAEDTRWQVKLINVKPGHELSLQMHHHRSEHWVVVSGTAKIEINDKEFFLGENESCYIPLGSKHRLSNPGRITLSLIEVQSGSYLGEDDIKRFEDIYGRQKNN